MSPEEQLEIEAVSRDLGDRLRRGDAEALKEVYERFAATVTARLHSHFGKILGENDLEDTVSQALLRVWTYRHRYDPARASMYTWFYLIARSEALDAVRKRLARPQIHFSDLSATQRGGLAAEERQAPAEAPAGSSPALEALQIQLARLGDQERQILLAFAEHEGREAWAANLAEAWHMPASTIRSKKRRAMERLRVKFIQEGFLSYSGEQTMAAYANQDAHAVEETHLDAIQALPTQFAGSNFLLEHSEQAMKLAARFKHFCKDVIPDDDDDRDERLAPFKEQWNHHLEQGNLKDSAQREAMVATYRWLKARNAREDLYRARVTEFIEQALKGGGSALSTFAREAPTEQTRRVEAAMAGIGRAILRDRPAEVAKKGEGTLCFDGATVHWSDCEEAFDLHDLATWALTAYGNLPIRIADPLASAFVKQLTNGRPLLPPDFKPAGGIDRNARSQTWNWKLQRTAESKNVDLPDFIKDGSSAELPTPLELTMIQHDEELARQFDQLLIEATLADLPLAESNEADPAQSAVRQLIELLSFEADCPREFVAGLFGVALRTRLNDEHCRAAAEALRFLWAELESQA